VSASGNYSSDSLSMLKCPKIVNQIKLSLNSNCTIKLFHSPLKQLLFWTPNAIMGN